MRASDRPTAKQLFDTATWLWEESAASRVELAAELLGHGIQEHLQQAVEDRTYELLSCHKREDRVDELPEADRNKWLMCVWIGLKRGKVGL